MSKKISFMNSIDNLIFMLQSHTISDEIKAQAMNTKLDSSAMTDSMEIGSMIGSATVLASKNNFNSQLAEQKVNDSTGSDLLNKTAKTGTGSKVLNIGKQLDRL